jgi:general secretion pathway protein C
MKKAFPLINLLLIFLIANSSVSIFYEYIEAKLQNNKSLIISRYSEHTAEQKNLYPLSFYADVTLRDLFKTNIVSPEPAKKIERPLHELKPTKLNLELKGTITGTGADPLAVISKKGSSEQMTYAVGDTIDQAVIKAIMKGKVILLVNGREEILFMKESKKGPASFSTQPSIVPELSNRKSVDITDGFVEQVALTWDDVNGLKEMIEDLRKEVRIRPYFFKGEMNGFRITNIKKDSVLYKKLGLKNGDIISAVNDKTIQSIDDVAGLYKEFNLMGGELNSNVTIQRMGKSGELHYSIQ